MQKSGGIVCYVTKTYCTTIKYWFTIFAAIKELTIHYKMKCLLTKKLQYDRARLYKTAII